MVNPRPIGTFCWCELGTSDVKRAKVFYEKLFGWSYADEDMGDMGTYTKVKLGDDELGGLYELKGPMFEGVPPHWMFHVAVEDVSSTAERAKEIGGSVVMPPMDIPDAGRMAMIEDPTGAKLALWQPGAHCGTTIGPMTTGSFGWVELQTRDAEAAKTFYTRLFGWDAKTDQGSTPYTEWLLPGMPPFAGMIQIDERWGDAPSAWLGYVMVEDCDATFARAKELGASPYLEPKDIENVGRFAVIADPQGAALAFIQLTATGS
jgi:predicted enzyme related to lactoylglutathione lyase